MYGFINKIIGLFLCVVMIVLMLSTVIVTDYLQATRSVIAEVTNFVDEVTDTGMLTPNHLSDLYVACASYGIQTDVQVMRYVKVVNPDPKNAEETVRTYVANEDIYTWKQGDLIRVKVNAIGQNGLASFLYHLYGLNVSNLDFTLAGRIR